MKEEYCVRKFILECGNLKFIANISGMGRNKNTWDYTHSKRTAKKYATICNLNKKTNELYVAGPIY